MPALRAKRGGGAQRGSRAVAPAWAAVIEGRGSGSPVTKSPTAGVNVTDGLADGAGSLHRGRSVETGGAQRGPRAVAPAWVAGIEGERVRRGADVGPENTDCQRFGGPGPRSLRGLAARNRNGCGWRGPGQIRPRPTAFFAYIANLA